MARMARIPRSRGAVSGVLLILLGAWGGLVPFVGPYFGYAYTPDKAWHFTLARLWLEIVPGAAAVLGGVLVAVSARRLLAGGGAVLAALGGAWFVVGRAVSTLWPHFGALGSPAGTSVRRGGARGAWLLHRAWHRDRVLRCAGAGRVASWPPSGRADPDEADVRR